MAAQTLAPTVVQQEIAFVDAPNNDYRPAAGQAVVINQATEPVLATGVYGTPANGPGVDIGAGESPDPLPVEFGRVSASLTEGTVEVRAVVLSEQNAGRFDLQWHQGVGENGQAASWTVVDTAPARGTAASAKTYRFRHALPPGAPQTLTYRVRETSTEGTVTHTAPVTVTRRAGQVAVRVWPQPMQQAGTVAVDLPQSAPVTLALYNLLGQRVRVLHNGDLSAGTHTLPLPTGALAPGRYVLRLSGTTDATPQTVPVVVVR